MMAQSRAESTRDTYNYGQYINRFPPNTIKVIREFERIQKKICRHKMSIMFNEICIYIYMCVCVCVCVRTRVGVTVCDTICKQSLTIFLFQDLLPNQDKRIQSALLCTHNRREYIYIYTILR